MNYENKIELPRKVTIPNFDKNETAGEIYFCGLI